MKTRGCYCVMLLLPLVFAVPKAHADFSPPLRLDTIPLSGVADAVELADFDLDGRLDFVTLGADGVVRLFLNDNSGAFNASVVPAPAIFGYGNDIAAGDFNSDSRPDFAVTDFSEFVHLFSNIDGSSFSYSSVAMPNSSLWGIDCADANGDQHADLIAAKHNMPSHIDVFLGDGLGGFALARHSPVEPDCSSPSNMAVTSIAADFNGDGYCDVIIGQDDDCDPGAAWLYLGDDTLGFTYAGEAYDVNTVHESDLSHPGAGTGDAFDLDRDGNLDIFTAGGSDTPYPIKFFAGDGSGHYPTSVIVLQTDLQGIVCATPPGGWRGVEVLCLAAGGNGVDAILVEFCSCLNQGDLDTSGAVDATDLAIVIDVVFFGRTDVQDPQCPTTRSDFDADGDGDAVDLALWIDYIFFGGPGPRFPCTPGA